MWCHTDPNHPFYSKTKSPKYQQAIADFWVELDKYIGRLLQYVGEETTIIHFF